MDSDAADSHISSVAQAEQYASGQPVAVGHSAPEEAPHDGVALCLSGGGYRAMLFHLGVLARLNDAGMLKRIDRFSSVSGGSITSAVLGMGWSQLTFDGHGVATNFADLCVEPVRRLARTRVDVGAVLAGVALPFVSVSDRVIHKLDEKVFHGATLADLPDEPRFVINATNLESGVLMRFSRPFLADYRVGTVYNPTLPLAAAVAASAAFPPFLSPMQLDFADSDWTTVDGNDLEDPRYRREIYLSDGGVYDNLGLQTAWNGHRTILVSDAGGTFSPDPEPDTDWARQMLRVLRIMDSQVRALRKRMVIDAFVKSERDGVYFSTRSDLADFPGGPHLPAPPDLGPAMASVPTRLTALDEKVQEGLINWGYAVADAGVRAHVEPGLAAGQWPYPLGP